MPVLGQDDIALSNKLLKKAYSLYDKRDKKFLDYCDSIEQNAGLPQGEILFRLYTLKSRILLDYSTADSSKEYLIRAKEIKQRFKISKWALAHWEITYGWYIFTQNNVNVAKKITLKALAKFSQLKDSNKIAGCFSNLGAFYLETKDYDIALDYFQKSEKINLKLNNYQGLGIVLNNIGLIYLEKRDYKKCIDIFNKSIFYYAKVNNKLDLTLTLKSNLVKAYILSEENEKALSLGKELYKTAMSQGYRPPLPFICSNLAYAYLNLNMPDSAMIFAQKGLEMANNLQYLNERMELLYAFYDIYEATKQYEEALKMLSTIDSLEATYVDTSLSYVLSDNKHLEEKIVQQDSYIKRLKLLQENEEELANGRLMFIYFTIISIIIISALGVYLLAILLKSKKSQSLLNYNNNLIQQQNEDLRQQTDFQLMLLNFIGNDLRNPLGELLFFENKLKDYIKDKSKNDAISYSNLMFGSISEMYQLSNSIVDWAKNIDKNSNLNFSEIKTDDFQVFLAQELNRISGNYFQLAFEKFELCNICIDHHSILISIRNIIEYTFKDFLQQGATLKIKGKVVDLGFCLMITHRVEDFLPTFDINNDELNVKIKFSNSLGLLLIKSILEMNKCSFRLLSNADKSLVFSITFNCT